MMDVETPVSLSYRRRPALRRGVRRHRYCCRQLPESSSVDVHIGRRLRLLRSELGLSREMLAKGVGLTVDRVEAHERGIKHIGAHRLIRYAEFLGVRLSAFFK
jgi:DNA-binding XRE family transcriptional regulator